MAHGHGRNLMLDADVVQASEVPALSPWPMATTSEHLGATSSPTMTVLSDAQGLSPAPSPAISDTTSPLATRPFTSTSQGLMVASAGLAPESPAATGNVGVSAGRHYASSQQSLSAGSHSRIFSGRPIAGLIRADPHVPLRIIKQQQVRYWQQVVCIVSVVSMMKQVAFIFSQATEGANPEICCSRSLVNDVCWQEMPDAGVQCITLLLLTCTGNVGRCSFAISCCSLYHQQHHFFAVWLN